MMSSNVPVYGTVLDTATSSPVVTMTVPASQVEKVTALGGSVQTTGIPTAPFATTPLPHQPRQLTAEKCRKGHPLVLVDYITACAFITMNKGSARDVYGGSRQGSVSRSSAQTLHCSHCLFQVEPQERVFLCEKCTMSKEQNPLPPVVFCETCVANGHNSKKNEWSSGCSSMANGSFADACLCHYCTLVGTELYTHSREEGHRPGEGDRCGLWGFVCLAVWTDIWAPFLLSTLWLNSLQRKTAALNNIEDPGCCNSFCQSYWCRCCVLGKVHRQWKTRESPAMGKIEGCLCGPMRPTPVTKPSLTPYRFAAPPALPAMDQQQQQQQQKTAAAVPDTNFQNPGW